MTGEAVPGLAHDRAGRRHQLPEQVAAYVRELIISGLARPGEFLRVERIAEEVGVSNTPVREGLLALRSEGFVQFVPRRGFVVAPFTRDDVTDLFWAQAQLARELAARAARKITPAQVGLLEENLEQYREAVKEADSERIADLSYAFHRQVNQAADAQRLALLSGQVASHLPRRFYASLEAQAAAGDDHLLLVDALRDHDARRARALMEQHILASADHLIEILGQRGLWITQEPSGLSSPSRPARGRPRRPPPGRVSRGSWRPRSGSRPCPRDQLPPSWKGWRE